ncbi:Os04g0486350 [Oryza sativa Japonica Group]|uniref:Os04g0486350 protein n=1 Tax=Oryza sativa subsp. japonica TaxID=39947 RepID=A0A0P0WBN7_ORYSJ|nr:hypothetical protein EE612_024067 [Oryza sativa]BAS89794.1 Os04g0486350 [Oryza sativa Japonica Group]
MVGERSNPCSRILAEMASQRCLLDLEVLKWESISRRSAMRQRVSSWTHVSARFLGPPPPPDAAAREEESWPPSSPLLSGRSSGGVGCCGDGPERSMAAAGGAGLGEWHRARRGSRRWGR